MAGDYPRQFADPENTMGCAVVDHGVLRIEPGCGLSACEVVSISVDGVAARRFRSVR